MASERESIELRRGELEEGSRLIEFTHEQAVYEARGQLFLCKCTEWDWQCIEDAGNIICWPVCKNWNCQPVPSRGLLE